MRERVVVRAHGARLSPCVHHTIVMVPPPHERSACSVGEVLLRDTHTRRIRRPDCRLPSLHWRRDADGSRQDLHFGRACYQKRSLHARPLFPLSLSLSLLWPREPRA